MSLGISAAFARRLILFAQKTRSRGGGGFRWKASPLEGNTASSRRQISNGRISTSSSDSSREYPLRDSIRGRAVLDLGSGYGGKTVEYAAQCGAARVCGVEPHLSMVERSRRYAATGHAANVEFAVCGARDVPYPDATFDIALTHDVLEHVVDDPRVTAAEIRRVLKPAGLSFNVFPLYLGAMSHHLDYIVNVPGIV
jgi:ubiquinone/menaquinone biosynthesis C-methylase UbiE